MPASVSRAVPAVSAAASAISAAVPASGLPASGTAAALALAELPPAAREHRSRLLEGMAQALAARGYAQTSIADVVREAGVSRRTFYEHFSCKMDCLIALYEAASHQALQLLVAAVDPAQPWRTQVEHAITAYIDGLAQNPVLTRTLFVEILGIGLPGLAARRRVHNALAGFVRHAVHAGAVGERVSEPLLSPAMALAVVGGITELVLQAVEQAAEQGTDADLRALVGPATQLVAAVAATIEA